MLNETDTINKQESNTETYGSISKSTNGNLWRNTKNITSKRACRSQVVFILLLLFICAFCILFGVYPLKQRLPNKTAEVDPSTCQTHICLYEESDITLTNTQITLLESHPSTITDESKFAFINFEQFEQSPDSLSITHPEGMIITLPLKSYRNDNDGALYYYQDNIEPEQDRFLISMNDEMKIVEGFAFCQAQKFELHSIGDAQFYLLIEKNWIEDNTDWCGIAAINSDYDLINANDDDAVSIDDNVAFKQDIAIWLSANNIITNHVGLDALLINKEISSDENEQLFMVEPLCSDQSQYDSYIYCLYPSTNSWQEFDDLRFYKYNNIDFSWEEISDFPLDLADSSINLPKSMCIVTDNEVYAFSVNPVDATVSVYSFTTSWRLHHYTPAIGGDIDKVEINSVFVNDVLYFSVNDYDPTGVYTVYHYTDNIFSIFDAKLKTDVPIYSHCLTKYNDPADPESDDQLLTFYIDYGHNLWAYYDDTIYNLDYNIASDIDVNQFECVWTEMGNIISWKDETNVYYLQLSPNDFQTLSYSMVPWNIELSEANLFQLISVKNSISDYKTVSVYYSNDIISNYLPDTTYITMDIESIISLSNIFYSINNKYESMMKLENMAIYDDNDDIDSFTSYEGESQINILLVDTMTDEDEIGYSQCEDDQSFAVVQYTAF